MPRRAMGQWFAALTFSLLACVAISAVAATAAGEAVESNAAGSGYAYDSAATSTTPNVNTRTDAPRARPVPRTSAKLVRLISGRFRAAKGTKRQAFRRAKRASGIPTSQQPRTVTPAVDRRGNPIPGKHHTFEVPTEGGVTASRDILHHP